MGFGGAGIITGSVAAEIQASIGNFAPGSLFAILTSLGMTGTLSTTAAVGAILGKGGISSFLVGKFIPDKDAKFINEIINNNDNPELIISILQFRKPKEREEIIESFESKYDDSFNCKVISFLPKKDIEHVQFLLCKTELIISESNDVKGILGGEGIKNYLEKEEDLKRDTLLIKNVIENHDILLIY